MKRVKFLPSGEKIIVDELPKVKGKKVTEKKEYICERCSETVEKLIYPVRSGKKVCNRCFMQLIRNGSEE